MHYFIRFDNIKKKKSKIDLKNAFRQHFPLNRKFCDELVLLLG